MDIRPEIIDFDFYFDFGSMVHCRFDLAVATSYPALRPSDSPALRIRHRPATKPKKADSAQRSAIPRFRAKIQKGPQATERESSGNCGHGSRAHSAYHQTCPKRGASMLKMVGFARQRVFCFRHPTFGVSSPPVGRSPIVMVCTAFQYC